ncbi:hypothetical protein KIW84_042954 [Lathyrus oleraceus]|uniref:Retrovirus-related Pol polyprotein from transposon TNT 1-94-like beta-barrel domain-containing protein n=1 Tax=Pisum sativum TaxID=3888 RepID=A0A9D5AU07_PEA|nr:hypothetical protein KIW84_042954 [Pisum sativum]
MALLKINIIFNVTNVKSTSILHQNENLIFSSINIKKYGHYGRQCRANSLNIRDIHARVAKTEDDMKMVPTTCHTIVDKNDDQWFLDTGCGDHLSGNKELFSDLDENFHSTVKLGDNSKIQVLGKGKIAIRLKDGYLNYISDVLYVPDICQNLLSL